MEEERLCTNCKIRKAEPHAKMCWECLKAAHDKKEKQKRMKALEEERRRRQQPEESLDEIARKAREAGMSYGKYLAARAAGRVK